jgi:predicted aldo/keto reductase-like oxidoreductase
MPSHKFINTLGILYRKKGRVTRDELESMCHIAWRRCVLCTRCYCPLGINIPEMIALVRRICRSQNVLPDFENTTGWEKHGQSNAKTAE